MDNIHVIRLSNYFVCFFRLDNLVFAFYNMICYIKSVPVCTFEFLIKIYKLQCVIVVCIFLLDKLTKMNIIRLYVVIFPVVCNIVCCSCARDYKVQPFRLLYHYTYHTIFFNFHSFSPAIYNVFTLFHTTENNAQRKKGTTRIPLGKEFKTFQVPIRFVKHEKDIIFKLSNLCRIYNNSLYM